MAGHQRSKVERHPGALDAKCGKLVSKLAGTFTLALDAEIIVGGADRAVPAVFPGKSHARTDGVFERAARDGVLSISAFGDHVFEPPLDCGVALAPGGKELHFHNTSRGHLPLVGDSFYEAYRGPDSTTLTGLEPYAAPLRNNQVSAQSSRFSDALGGNDDVHYVCVNTDSADQPQVKIGG